MKKTLRKIGRGLSKALYYVLVFLGILIVLGLIMTYIVVETADDYEDFLEIWEDDE